MPDAVREKLIHVGDLHFWRLTFNPLRQLNKRVLGNLNLLVRRRHEFVMEHAEPYLDHVTSIGIQDAVFTGDFTTTSLSEEFEMARAFMQRAADAGLRSIAIPGNHDVYTFAVERRDAFRQHLGEWSLGDTLPAVHHLSGGTPIIFVPTVCANWLTSEGIILDAEIARLRELLNGVGSRAIVAGHYPLLDETPSYSMSMNRRLRGADSLRQALGESGKSILYICGHVHRFSYVADPQHAGVQYLTTGTLFGRNHSQHRDGEFSEIHVTDGGWLVFNHVHDGEWRRDAVACAQLCLH